MGARVTREAGAHCIGRCEAMTANQVGRAGAGLARGTISTTPSGLTRSGHLQAWRPRMPSGIYKLSATVASLTAAVVAGSKADADADAEQSVSTQSAGDVTHRWPS
jgi:hypothetical protein